MKFSIIWTNLVLLIIFGIFSSCAHKKKTLNDSVTQEGVATLQAIWIKDKAKKFDMAVKLTNLSTKPLLIPNGAMTCRKGSLEGKITKTSLDHVNPNISWILQPSQTVEFYFVCTVEQKIQGEMMFTIKELFENKNLDSPDRGNRLAEGLTLTIQ